MKNKVLLINLPSDSIRKPEEHCGLAFLKAYLELNNVDTDILDAYAKRKDIEYCKNYISLWIKKNSDCNKYIGISPFVTSYEYFIELGKYIKQHFNNCKVFAGGHFATLNKEYVLDNNLWLDAIIVGEGEVSLFEYVRTISDTNIDGVYQRKFKKQYKPRERIINLDELPFQSRYLSTDELEGQPFAITTSRGCYGECSFCSISSFYKTNTIEIKQTFRSAKSVSEEIHNLVKKYKINSIKIVDDNFFRTQSNDFLEQLIEFLLDIKISIRVSARPNDITEKRAELLEKLGVTVVAIGAESAHKESLKLFNKGIEIESSDNAIRFLDDNNITCLVNFIMFNPIIDIDGIEDNCNFIERHIEDCLFHRINSHLWIRSTDPIVETLVLMGLCK